MNQVIKNKLLLLIIALIVLLLMVSWMAGRFNEKIPPQLIAHPKQASNQVIKVSTQLIANFEQVAGTVTAKQATELSSRVLARIDDIVVAAGDVVEKGQLLLTLEQQDAKAQLAQALEFVKQVLARQTEAQQQLNRVFELHGKKLVATAALDNAKANHQALSAELLAARQGLMAAETNLSYHNIVAPFTGVVVDRFAEPGNTAQPGMKLLTIYNPNSLRIEAQVRETVAVNLKVGQLIHVNIPSIGQQHTAEIEEIVPAANTGSRSFLVKSRIYLEQNTSRPAKVLPGMYAQLQLELGQSQRLVIPTSYTQKFGQLTQVMVNEHGVIQRRFIKVIEGPRNDQLIVLSGLKAGEQLIPPTH